jgi:hypothetical protein
LITNSNFVAALPAGCRPFLALENPPRIDAGLPIGIGIAGPVTRQTTGRDVLTQIVDCGHRMLRRAQATADVCLQLSAYLNSPDSCLSSITGTVKIRVTNPTTTAKGTAKVENNSPSDGPTRCAVPPKIKAEIETSALYTRNGTYSKMKVITKVTAAIATELINQARMKVGQLRVRHAFWSKSSVSGINRNILNICSPP